MKRLVNLFYCSLSDESRFQSSLPHLYRIWTILYHLNIYMFITIYTQLFVIKFIRYNREIYQSNMNIIINSVSILFSPQKLFFLNYTSFPLTINHPI